MWRVWASSCPAARGRQGRTDSVIQLGLYAEVGDNEYELLASTEAFTVAGSGGDYIAPLSSSTPVQLSSGDVYVALLVQSSGTNGLLVWADNSADATIGPMDSADSLPSSFSSIYGNYPFRVRAGGLHATHAGQQVSERPVQC